MPKKHLISIVDDDESVRISTMDLVTSMGYVAKTFARAKAFLASDSIKSTTCLIADMRMPEMTGLELYSSLVQSGKKIPTILVTAFPDEQDRTRARRAGVTCYLAKPFNDVDLLTCVRTALASHHPK